MHLKNNARPFFIVSTLKKLPGEPANVHSSAFNLPINVAMRKRENDHLI